jgi:hypothetical protein
VWEKGDPPIFIFIIRIPIFLTFKIENPGLPPYGRKVWVRVKSKERKTITK